MRGPPCAVPVSGPCAVGTSENLTATPAPTQTGLEAAIAELRVAVPDYDDVQQGVACSHHAVARTDPWYLGAWLSTEVGGEQLRRLARGSGIQRIAMKDLSSPTISVPHDRRSA